jgi:hypothetical protein
VQPTQQRGTRLQFLSGALALCGLASWVGLVEARNSGDSMWTLIFGMMCVCLLLATVQSIALSLVRRVQSSPRRLAIDSAQHLMEHGEYIAKCSTHDRVVAVLLVGAFVLISGYRCIHPVPLYMRCVSVGMLAMLVWIAYRFLFTTVRFTSKRITIRIFPFNPYSEYYSDIVSVRAHLGNLRIRFADGRSLNLWAGLGDAVKIIAILERRVEVLPKPGGLPKGRYET